MTTAIVLGGGFAGVLTANVLSEHADEVVLVEGARYPAGPGIRSGLPQAFHTHVLMAGGARALDELLPGTVDALLAHGAHQRGFSAGTLILSADGWFRRHDCDAYLISCSRWLTDHMVRRQALAAGSVSVLEGTTVRGLTGDASRVTGVAVRLPDGSLRTIRADIVVDATGRRSRAGRWLAALGGAGVEEELVDSGLTYATRMFRAPAGFADEIPAIMVHPSAQTSQPDHGATLFPIEDDRWIVTVTGTRGAAPPTDEHAFADCAMALRSPIVAELMAVAKPLSGVRPYGGTKNRRRYYERLPRPAGFLVVGDALVAVNPVYSHGMSVAALSALRLRRELAERGADPRVVASLQSAMAEEADHSWRVATEKDRGQADTPAPPSEFQRRSRARMAAKLLSSPILMTEFFRSQALIPSRPAVDRSYLRELSGEPDPPLSADEAVAQYPGLAEWWLSGRDHSPVAQPGRQP